MDKKRLVKTLDKEDMKGFEDFIEGQPSDTNFLPRPSAGNPPKKDTGFEHFTFLATDSVRLTKLKDLLSSKLPFSMRFEQGNALLKEQREEVQLLRAQLFDLCDQKGAPYRKSLSEVFDSFFEPPKS